MMIPQIVMITRELNVFLKDFVSTFPPVREIWLFGSRVDGTALASSDWDLLVLSGDELTPEAVAAIPRFQREDYVLFIAHGGEFHRPWPRSRDGAVERGYFSEWKWQSCGDRATYVSAKEGRPLCVKPALRIWYRSQVR